MRFEITTRASPEQVQRALTDFSDQRLETWSRTLDPKTYELRDHGDTWATARESSPGSPFWVVSRYDWSDPGVVRWTVVESSYGGAGTGLVRIEPRADGGSRLLAEWDSTGARTLQRPLLFLLHHGPMWRVVARMWTSALDRFADSEAH
ncbi:MAG: SRPBCC family protein [Nocardioides sp.]